MAFPFVKENNSLMILNAISKTNEIVATGESKLIMIPEVQVPEEVVAASKSATSTSKAKHVAKVVDLLDQKEGTIFNIIGKVIEAITNILLSKICCFYIVSNIVTYLLHYQLLIVKFSNTHVQY